jgi:Holliday junction resolvase
VSRYRKGYRLERRVERLYTEYGWLATRFPKSGRRLYPADVLAVKKTANRARIHLIECKNLSKKDQKKNAIYISKEQIGRLIKKARKHNAEAFVAYSFPRQHVRIVEATRLGSSGKMFSVGREDGTPLKKVLKRVGQTKLLNP